MNVIIKLGERQKETGSIEWENYTDNDTGYTVWFRGHAFSGERCLEGETLAKHFLSTLRPDIKTAKATLHKLTGSFAVVCQGGGEFLAAVDRVRSIPLFFSVSKNRVMISDDPSRMDSENKRSPFSHLPFCEFLLAGYVTGAATILDGVSQIPPGHLIHARDNAGKILVQPSQYYEYFYPEKSDAEDADLEAELSQVFNSVFDRYYKLWRYRKIVVPLSGGLDSRLIIAMLKKIGCTNVLCYSYGNPNSQDSKISREIAQKLGFEWKFIPYPNMNFWTDLQKEDLFRRYVDFGAQYSSLAHPQDWPALRILQKEFDGERAVIIPGHTGDFLSGGHIPIEIAGLKGEGDFLKTVCEAIFSHHYDLWPLSECDHTVKKAIVRKIAEQFPNSPKDPDTAAKCYEKWEWNGRQSRFIVNSVRVYDFFGQDWAIPLWDKDLMDFFGKLRLNQKFGKRIYINTLCKHVFSDSLKQLLRVPTHSTSILTYRSKSEWLKKTKTWRRALDFTTTLPGIVPLASMIRNKRADSFFVYGCFMKYRQPISLLRPLKELIHSWDGLESSEINEIIKPSANKPILSCNLRGLLCVDYLIRQLSDKG